MNTTQRLSLSTAEAVLGENVNVTKASAQDPGITVENGQVLLQESRNPSPLYKALAALATHQGGKTSFADTLLAAKAGLSKEDLKIVEAQVLRRAENDPKLGKIQQALDKAMDSLGKRVAATTLGGIISSIGIHVARVSLPTAQIGLDAYVAIGLGMVTLSMFFVSLYQMDHQPLNVQKRERLGEIRSDILAKLNSQNSRSTRNFLGFVKYVALPTK